jgi:hypothetical protein
MLSQCPASYTNYGCDLSTEVKDCGYAEYNNQSGIGFLENSYSSGNC